MYLAGHGCKADAGKAQERFERALDGGFDDTSIGIKAVRQLPERVDRCDDGKNVDDEDDDEYDYEQGYKEAVRDC